MKIAAREVYRWLDAIEDLAESDPLGAAREVDLVTDYLTDWQSVTRHLRQLTWRRTKAFYELSNAALARELGVSRTRVNQVLNRTAK